ncbi:MAG: baseplate J/gp47 family protein [Spirochaetaceae bacterium]|jgi:uncharacterized phage protein gp47/JayE|nr:baseplate J/gp47 family protein [Spirochaetaceae bacterium]
MPFKRDSLAVVQERIYANYMSLFRPIDKTPRHSLLKVLAHIDAGIEHQILGDLDFLSLQLFPDTATGAYLREHWSSRVTPLSATHAAGNIIVSGLSNINIPAGLVFKSASGEKYYSEQSGKTDSAGSDLVHIKAENAGLNGNLSQEDELKIISQIPVGINAVAVVASGGILGGANAESDEEYLTRVLLSLRNPVRYGKKDDFAAWARDASPEVSAAWEFKNFGVFGALLVQVINGNQFDGVSPVGGLDTVRDYISDNAPPVMFTVRSPAIVNLNPKVTLSQNEDTLQNRERAVERLKGYMQVIAMPGIKITAGALRTAIIDGVDITDAQVFLNDDIVGIVNTTILEYPYIGEVTWQ